MNKTALFLICLIVPIAFCQQDILNMLDKTPEGKEVLNHLFIQTKLMGSDLDVAVLRNFLKTNGDKAEADRKAAVDYMKVQLDACDADMEALKGVVSAHHEKELSIKRTVDTIKRRQVRAQTKLERAQEELENYQKFASYISNNKNAWADYYAKAQENMKKVHELLSQINDATKSIPTPSTGASFVQIPTKFTSSLAQIRMKIQTTDVDFNGMGPVISNLMEIMQSPDNMRKPEVVVAVRSLVDSLIEAMRERKEQLEEENDVQTTLFGNLEKAFNDNVSRSQKEVDSLKTVSDNLAKRLQAVINGASHAESLTGKVSDIFELRAEECRDIKMSAAEAAIRHEKLNAVIAEIESILVSKSQGLQAFFIQRQMQKFN